MFGIQVLCSHLQGIFVPLRLLSTGLAVTRRKRLVKEAPVSISLFTKLMPSCIKDICVYLGVASVQENSFNFINECVKTLSERAYGKMITPNGHTDAVNTFVCIFTAEKVTSLGKDWHRPCLKCEKCKKTLSSGSHAEVGIRVSANCSYFEKYWKSKTLIGPFPY